MLRSLGRLSAVICLTAASGCATVLQTVDYESFEQSQSSSATAAYTLPRTLVHMTVDWDPRRTGTGDQAALQFDVAPHRTADLEHRYIARFNENILSGDSVCVAVDNGYLQSVQVASDNRTAQIVVTLSELLARGAGGAGGVLPPPSAGGLGTTVEGLGDGASEGQPQAEVLSLADQPFRATFIFDPLDEAQYREETPGSPAAFLSPRGFVLNPSDFQAIIDGARTARGRGCPEGALCYRLEVATTMRITHRDRPVAAIDEFNLIDASNVAQINIERGVIADRFTALTFSNGVLETVRLEAPSELEVAVNLPLDVLDSILAVPGDFIGRLTGSTAEREALQAEQAAQAQRIAALNTALESVARRTEATAGETLVTRPAANSLQISCTGANGA